MATAATIAAVAFGRRTSMRSTAAFGRTRRRFASRSLQTACAATATAEAEAPASLDAEEVVKAAKRPGLRFERSEDNGIKNMMVTTPLFYANGPPHIGSAYPTIASDVMARYCLMQGANVHFVTGMDEHGEKIARTAADLGKQPQELVDEISDTFLDLWEKLSIENNHFARTTSDNHKKIVNEFWQRCLAKGDIYQKDYEGYYCVGCEAYLDGDEMLEGDGCVCAIHRKPCELRKEENYFFRLSKYWDQIVKHMNDNPDFVLPTNRRNEILYWLKDDNKRDFSISRASTSWGIPVPGDDSQVIYVWFDALLGYISSLLPEGSPVTLEAALANGYPADAHVIGKDIMRFHAIYWPAMLMSADLPLPKHICTHGFLTKDGLKMGKSLGNVVEPIPLVEAFGSDAVRYYFGACLSFGEDGDFSYENFIKKVNAALANELGNLLHRILTLCRKNLPEAASPISLYAGLEAEAEDNPVYKAAKDAPAMAAKLYEQFDFPKAANAALAIASAANVRMNVVEPWAKLKGSDEDKALALREMVLMAEAVRICALLLAPLTPDLTARVLAELGEPTEGKLKWSDTAWRWDATMPGLCGGKKPKPVFQRIDVEPWIGK